MSDGLNNHPNIFTPEVQPLRKVELLLKFNFFYSCIKLLTICFNTFKILKISNTSSRVAT